MKTILIETGFSPASGKATSNGGRPDKTLKAKIILFNAFRGGASSSDPKKGKLRTIPVIGIPEGAKLKQNEPKENKEAIVKYIR